MQSSGIKRISSVNQRNMPGKIAIFCATLERGGAERTTINLADFFVRHGVACDIITSSNPKEDEYPTPDGVVRICAGGKGVLKLRRAITQSRPDILIIMTTPSCIFAIPACIGMKLKTVVSERSAPKQAKIKMITKFLSHFFLRFADGFIFQTEDAKRYYDRLLHGRGTVIPNALLSDKFPELCLEGTRKKEIVSVGRLNPLKRHDMLIEAFSRLPHEYRDYTLTIFGEGTYRTTLEKLIIKKNLQDRVRLLGVRPDVLEQIRMSALFVLSSDYEGMPNALLEAMALGLPCISTDCPCGGPRSVIENGVNGVLIPVGDVEALTEAITEILGADEKASRMGQNAVKIREILDAEVIHHRWMEYLKSI